MNQLTAVGILRGVVVNITAAVIGLSLVLQNSTVASTAVNYVDAAYLVSSGFGSSRRRGGSSSPTTMSNRRLVERQPFEKPSDENVTLSVTFLPDSPPDGRIEALIDAQNEAEQFAVDGREVYSRAE